MSEWFQNLQIGYRCRRCSVAPAAGAVESWAGEDETCHGVRGTESPWRGTSAWRLHQVTGRQVRQGETGVPTTGWWSKLAEAQIPLRRLCDKVWDKFTTESRTCRGHKSWKSATRITSPTFMICVRDKSATLSGTCPGLCRRLCRQLSPCIVNLKDQIPLERHKRVCRGLLTDFVANISTCRGDFCPRLSRYMYTTFPAGKFRWKSA